jgi:hypothetical protein
VDDERREQTLALLKLLALGDREIERGWHVDAVELYAEIGAG